MPQSPAPQEEPIVFWIQPSDGFDEEDPSHYEQIEELYANEGDVAWGDLPFINYFSNKFDRFVWSKVITFYHLLKIQFNFVSSVTALKSVKDL